MEYQMVNETYLKPTYLCNSSDSCDSCERSDSSESSNSSDSIESSDSSDQKNFHKKLFSLTNFAKKFQQKKKLFSPKTFFHTKTQMWQLKNSKCEKLKTTPNVTKLKTQNVKKKLNLWQN